MESLISSPKILLSFQMFFSIGGGVFTCAQRNGLLAHSMFFVSLIGTLIYAHKSRSGKNSCPRPTKFEMSAHKTLVASAQFNLQPPPRP